MNKLNDNLLVGWKEVADYLGCSVATAARREPDGLPVFRSGGQVRAFTDDIDRWLKGLRGNEPGVDLSKLEINSIEESDDVPEVLTKLMNDGKRDKVVVLNLGKNASDYEKVEVRLQSVEEKYNTLLEEVPEWIWEMNEVGEFVFSNKRITEILGYLPGEIEGATLYDFLLYPDDVIESRTMFLMLAEKREVIRSYRCRFIHRDNTICYIESSCKPIFNNRGRLKGYSGISRDVTERTRMEHEISNKRLYLESVLDNSIDGIIIADIDGNIEFHNNVAGVIFGYRTGEMNEINISQLFSTPNSPLVLDDFLSALEEKSDSVFLENIVLRRKNGKAVTVSVSSSIIRNESQNPVGIATILRELKSSDNRDEKPGMPDMLINAILENG
ncbi:MAG: PAS domain S-box protein [bacterium]|nr:PAS domain S-box protein [bacterium]